MNISTGKFVTEGCPLLGTPTSVEFNSKGNLLWVGNDRGTIESFKLECNQEVKVRKGCRITASAEQESLTSLSYRSNLGRISCKPCLLVTGQSKIIRLFSVEDDSGRLEFIMTFEAGFSRSCLLASIFAPLMASVGGIYVAAGASDGSLLFFDLEKRLQKKTEVTPNCCVNKILGHAKPVIALAYSRDENFIASADQAGQIIVWKK